MNIRAVIWDLGGVIVRTEDKQPRTALAERCGLTYAEIDELVFNSESGVLAATGKISERAHWEEVCRKLNIPAEQVEEVQEAFWGGDRVDARLVEYIRSLRPKYQTALLSNAWTSLRDYLTDHWRIIDAFDHVFISAERGLAKPARDIYQLVVDEMGIAPQEGVFVDDFAVNIEAARAAGLHTVHFRNTEQAIAEVEQLLKRSS